MSFGSTDDTSAFLVAAVLRRAAPEGSRCSPRSRAAARRNDLDADQRPVTILSEEGPASYHSASNLLPASNHRCTTEHLVPLTATRASAASSIVLRPPRGLMTSPNLKDIECCPTGRARGGLARFGWMSDA